MSFEINKSKNEIEQLRSAIEEADAVLDKLMR